MGVTSVTLGSFFTTSDGKTVLGGAGGSGLDTQSLIDSLVTAQKAPITQDQDQITVNNSQSSALTTFQNLLSTFQSSVDALRNPPGVGNAADNVFAFTTGSVGNGGSSYVSVATSPGAVLQTYNISDISSLASAASQGTGTFSLASADSSDATANPGGGAAYFTPGTITFGSATGTSVTVAAGDSLSAIAAKFNAVSEQTGINATVIQVDSDHYRLSFTATSTGSGGNFDLKTSPTVYSGESVLSTVALTSAASGTPASFKINGIPVTRDSNSINDVINGVTFNLLQTSPSDTNYPVTIQPDTTTIQNSIVGFVNAYNALKTFATQQTQLTSKGTYASSAVLATNQTFRQTMNDINANVLNQVEGITGSDPKSLSDIGITFTNQPATSTAPEVDNILTVNDGQLSSELASNFSGVKNLFGVHFVSNNPNLALFKDSNSVGVTQFTLTASNGVFTATGGGMPQVTLQATALPGGGYTLTGPAGSALDGLQMIYASSADATINVTLTQGIADQAYNTSVAATKASTGTLAVAQQDIQTRNTTLNNDITRLNALVSQYQQQLLNEFAALEKAISQTNTLLQSLNANENAALTSSGH